MNIRSVLFTVLSCAVSTLVTAWLLGSLVAWVMEEAGSAGQEVLVLMNTPWFGAKPHADMRRVEPVTVVGSKREHPTLVAKSVVR